VALFSSYDRSLRSTEYIFGLHELPLTAMADGYAMASGGLGVVCVHISCGLGNAMAMLYNAYCAGTPLLLLAGQQDRRLRLGEPVLEGDTVSVNAQYKILKVSGAVMQLPHMTQKKYLGMDLAEPEVDFVGLARSFGVKAHQVTEPDELSERVRDSLNQTEPILLNVPIER
jgi:thiamine pyrophosphate-dependent acetolactate synthase large subunit-like protein